MDDTGMVNAITDSIQTEANVITLIQAMITTSIQSMNTQQLQNVCTILGIDYTQPDPGSDD